MACFLPTTYAVICRFARRKGQCCGKWICPENGILDPGFEVVGNQGKSHFFFVILAMCALTSRKYDFLVKNAH